MDIIDVSGGVCGSRPAQLQGKQGYFIPQAQRIKKVVDIPVIGVGGITEAEFADKTVREGGVGSAIFSLWSLTVFLVCCAVGLFNCLYEAKIGEILERVHRWRGFDETLRQCNEVTKTYRGSKETLKCIRRVEECLRRLVDETD